MNTAQLTVGKFEGVNGDLAACWSTLTLSLVATGRLNIRVFSLVFPAHEDVCVRLIKENLFHSPLVLQHKFHLFSQSLPDRQFVFTSRSAFVETLQMIFKRHVQTTPNHRAIEFRYFCTFNFRPDLCHRCFVLTPVNYVAHCVREDRIWQGKMHDIFLGVVQGCDHRRCCQHTIREHNVLMQYIHIHQRDIILEWG